MQVCDAPVAHGLYFVPAMGVAARHYQPLAEAMAAQGVAMAVHEWRGLGSSQIRASRQRDWAYRELLDDLAVGWQAARQWQPQVAWSLGGHSLGGQLACVLAGLTEAPPSQLTLVASGAPYWRAFPYWWAPLLYAAYALVPAVVGACGYFPGRRLGFGGREARGVMRDWARSGRRGRYAGAGMQQDLEHALARVQAPVYGLVMAHDVFAPNASLSFLLAKMPKAPARISHLDGQALGASANHFAWMRQPAAVVDMLAPMLLDASG
nr:alpha/beta hydrolase [Oleiagrimonas sp. C23AA]